MADVMTEISRLAVARLAHIMRNREAYLEAWVAEYGVPPSDCILIEQSRTDGSLEVRVVRGTCATCLHGAPSFPPKKGPGDQTTARGWCNVWDMPIDEHHFCKDWEANEKLRQDEPK